MVKKLIFGSVLFACAAAFSLLSTANVYCAESVTAKENLEQLIKTNECRGCDLAGVNLNRVDLSDADLEGADLSNAKMSLTNLSRANLRNTNLRGVVFGGTDLGDADLRGSDLRGTSLDGAYIGGALLDGVFVTTKPYEDIDAAEIKREVYIADPSKPKEKPKTKEVVVAPRRVFEEPPPAIIVEEPQKKVKKTKSDAPIELTSNETELREIYPQAPAIKKPTHVQKAVIEEKVEPVVPEKKIAEKSETIKKQEKIVSAPVAPIAKMDEVVKEDEVVEEASAAPVAKAEEVTKVTPAVSTVPVVAEPEKISGDQDLVADKQETIGAIGEKNQHLAAEKKKRDNLTRLFDTNKCYGCDLSGLDLSKKNLDGADLEKADLTDCNLEKVDLEEANLKGTLLVNANLRGANLEEADLYRADLTGADLTGANIKKALFDNAKTSGAVGLNTEAFLLNK